VVGGSVEYVRRIAAELPDIRTGTRVVSASRTMSGVVVTDEHGRSEHFDQAVIATHPADALSMRTDASALEKDVLGGLSYTPSRAVLHRDAGLLPEDGPDRASWNFRQSRCDASDHEASISYDLNRLQGLSGAAHVLTLNPDREIRPDSVLAEMRYEHPLYTPESLAAQRNLPRLNSPTLAYAGAYHGWGFHEDGCRSGVTAARALGARW
jgi:predicted NAD/FAD-binding protein